MQGPVARQVAVFAFAAMLAVAKPCPVAADAIDEARIAEIVVTSQRRAQPLFEHAGNIALIDADELQAAGHQHIHELMTRIAGVWITRGSGQEHLTAIRSPMLTGAGSCGAFLYLEDGIPVRPAGFCNVNQMLEVATELASRVEIIRGPANALYGSNALHGVVNVSMPSPVDARSPFLALEAGANDFLRLRGELPFDAASPYLLSAAYADDGGFRDDSGYRQAKLHAKATTALLGGETITGLTATDLDQETAGFIFGQDAYKDPLLNRANLNPEAFRNADSQRLYAIWRRATSDVAFDVRPYFRRSRMDFLQHFLPGQPLEENGQQSAGLIATITLERSPGATIVAGTDLEWSDTFLKQTQFGPTEGSDFLRETRPEGKHYDYDVTTQMAAAYVQGEWQTNQRLTLHAGLRLEHLEHDYDNRMLDGNTRDDGTACGFGGCLYSRPASRSDSFTNLAPKFAALLAVGEDTTVYANLARGFRAPQATELYRLQSGQQVADLDSESIDSIELGLRSASDNVRVDISAYFMRKRNSVLRDAEGFNVSNGQSRHAGVDAELDLRLHELLVLSADLGYGRHTYDFDLVAARGETFVSGNDVDTAPRWLGNVELRFEPSDNIDMNLQWVSQGKYYLDAENRFTYPGHDLLNLRVQWRATPALDVVARLNNVTDARIADRADYAFGNYRYFPGRGREAFLEIRYTRNESL